MWKKRLLNAHNSESNDDSMETDLRQNATMVDIKPKHRFSYRASLKNGQLVEDEKGPLIITHNYVPSVNNNYVDNDIDMSKHDPNTPLDLTISKGRVKVKTENGNIMNIVFEDINESGYNTSPISTDSGLDLTMPKKSQDTDSIGDNLSVEARVLLDYPYLKLTNTGALVLWNFLWALLQDVNYKHVAIWTSFVELKFRIVDCELLAQKWGQIKQNQAMDWNKIRKILELYLRKQLIRVCSKEDGDYQFLIIPKHVRKAMIMMERANDDMDFIEA